jgi:protein-S-isoprenylcysteine O-methyltransferase Ste14
MSASERLLNALFGLSAISWAVLGLATVVDEPRALPIRICLALLNLSVGLLFLTRRPLVREGTLTSLLICIPSFAVCGFAFKMSAAPDLWPVYAEAVFITGTTLTMISFCILGRCFAIFPAVRGTVVRGPYRIVRHPAYAGEWLMVLACFLAQPTPATVALLLFAVPCLILRIQAEERLLVQEPAYQAYAAQVAWRLLPGIW